MEKFYNKPLSELGSAIKELEPEADKPIQRIEAVIGLIIKRLPEIKKYVLKRGFKNKNQSICFF